MNDSFFNPPILSSFKDYFIQSSFWRTLWLALAPNPSFVTYSMLQRRLVEMLCQVFLFIALVLGS